MVGILPRIEELTGAPVGNWDVVRAIENALENIAVSHRANVIETLQGRRILCLDRVKGAPTFNVFKPEMGIVIGCFERGPCIETRHDVSRTEETRPGLHIGIVQN